MSEEKFVKGNEDECSTDEEEFIDNDSCNNIELAKAFKFKYGIADEKVVSLKNEWVLQLAADRDFARVAAGLSNGTVKLFDLEKGSSLMTAQSATPPQEKNNLCGLMFLKESANELLIGTTDSGIRLFDLRTCQQTANFIFEDSKPVLCFDVNANGRAICAGTETQYDSVSIHFFDVRTNKHMGSYLDSHSRDVTCVRFHPTKPDLLCTGAVDGLINQFSIEQPDEDEALFSTVNTESSVHKIDWHLRPNQEDQISCITNTNDFMVYESDDLVAEFSRSKITEAARRTNAANCNLVSAHSQQNGQVFLVIGSNFNKGKVLRTLYWDKEQLLPMADFEDNKQIVRESLFDAKSNLLLTAGESGFVSLWNVSTADTHQLSTDSQKLKSKHKNPKRKTDPY